MVYTSTSKALATLEWLVHLDQSVSPSDMVEVSLTIPPEIKVARMGEADLPEDWRRVDHPALQAMGADWVTSGSSVALQVPSAVIDGEWNVLINPAHPDFARLVQGKPKPHSLDRRLLKDVRT
jgi:RES domain-containing protein